MSLFEVGHLIASGSFSKVYEGTHIFSDKVKVALKCIPKRRADRYLDIVRSKPEEYVVFYNLMLTWLLCLSLFSAWSLQTCAC